MHLKKTICLNDTNTFHGDTFISSRNVSEKLLLGNHPILSYLIEQQFIGGVQTHTHDKELYFYYKIIPHLITHKVTKKFNATTPTPCTHLLYDKNTKLGSRGT